MYSLDVYLSDIANLITNALNKTNSGVKGFAKAIDYTTNEFYVGFEVNKLTMLTLTSKEEALTETIFDKVSEYVGVDKARIDEIVAEYMKETHFEYIHRIACESTGVIYEEHENLYQFGVSELIPNLSTDRVKIENEAKGLVMTITYGDMEDDIFETLHKTRTAVITYINNKWRDPERRTQLKSYLPELEIVANYTKDVETLTDTGIETLIGNWTFLQLHETKVVYENKDWELPTIKHYLESLEK